MLLKLQWASEPPGGLVKTPIPWPYPRVPDLVDLGWGLKICVSSKLQDTAAWRNSLREPLV